ncbi:MAG: hypothetical protein AABZ57_03150, partial [Candidatus Margulisiibacteriota bacterium]
MAVNPAAKREGITGLREQHREWVQQVRTSFGRINARVEIFPVTDRKQKWDLLEKRLFPALDDQRFISTFDIPELSERDKVFVQGALLSVLFSDFNRLQPYHFFMGYPSFEDKISSFVRLFDRFFRTSSQSIDYLGLLSMNNQTSSYAKVAAGIRTIGLPAAQESRVFSSPEGLFSYAMEFLYDHKVYNKELLLRLARKCISYALPMEPGDNFFLQEETDTFGSKSHFDQDPRLISFADVPLSETTELWARAVRRAEILIESGTVYTKPLHGAQSIGVANVSIEDNCLMVRSKDINLLNAFRRVKTAPTPRRNLIGALFHPDEAILTDNGLSDLYGPDRNDIFEFGPTDSKNDTIIVKLKNGNDLININYLALFFELLEDRYIEAGLGDSILEASINTPLINGSTWEIRTVNQLVLGRRGHVSYAKIGASNYIGNIAAGGSGMDST